MSLRAFKHTSAAAHLDGQVHCANTLSPVPQTHVAMVASALPLSPTTSVRAHLSSLERIADKTSMSVTPTHLLARTVEFALMRSGGTIASALRSTQGNTAIPATCPAILPRALMEAPASRKETPAMNAPVFQVLLEKTATTTLTTVRVMDARMEEPVWMVLTPTTVSVNRNLQASSAQTMLMNVC